MKNRFTTLTQKTVLGALCMAQLTGATNGFAGGETLIIAATGGDAIPADTANATWTRLTGPVIVESYARDIGWQAFPARGTFDARSKIQPGPSESGI